MMELRMNQGPRENMLQFDHARLCFKNFKGEEGKYNRAGDRSFAIVVETEEQYDALKADLNKYDIGWNVQKKESKEAGGDPFMYLKVKLKFNDNGPGVYLIAGNSRTKLNEHSVGILDDINILDVCVDVRPYDSEISGSPFRAAYVHAIQIVQDVDRFEAEFAAEEFPEE